MFQEIEKEEKASVLVDKKTLAQIPANLNKNKAVRKMRGLSPVHHYFDEDIVEDRPNGKGRGPVLHTEVRLFNPIGMNNNKQNPKKKSKNVKLQQQQQQQEQRKQQAKQEQELVVDHEEQEQIVVAATEHVFEEEEAKVAEVEGKKKAKKALPIIIPKVDYAGLEPYKEKRPPAEGTTIAFKVGKDEICTCNFINDSFHSSIVAS